MKSLKDLCEFKNKVAKHKHIECYSTDKDIEYLAYEICRWNNSNPDNLFTLDEFITHIGNNHKAIKIITWNECKHNKLIPKSEFINHVANAFDIILWNQNPNNEKFKKNEFLYFKPDAFSMIRWNKEGYDIPFSKSEFLKTEFLVSDCSSWNKNKNNEKVLKSDILNIDCQCRLWYDEITEDWNPSCSEESEKITAYEFLAGKIDDGEDIRMFLKDCEHRKLK